MKRPEKIVQLDRQLADLKERNRRAEQVLSNRRQRLENAERTHQRKLDTRRKILIGAAVIAEAETDPELRKWLTQDFPAHLTHDRERALFGLPPLDEADAAADGWLSRWTSRLSDAAPSWLRFGKEDS